MKNVKTIMKLQKKSHSIRFSVPDITGIDIRKKIKQTNGIIQYRVDIQQPRPQRMFYL